MNATLISGKAIAEKTLETELRPRVERLYEQGIEPKLVVLLVGDHAASKSYVTQKEKFAAQANIASEVRHFPSNIPEEDLLQEIELINNDDSIHGLIVQLPLPEHISVPKVLATIDPKKDVDGFTAENIGKLFLNEPCLQCCTPKGILRLIEASGTKIEGAHAVVLGRSNIVGKPLSILLLNKNATLTICHSHTKDLDNKIAQADILVVAVGKPEFLHGDQIPKGATVIDVGIHRREDGSLCGDVHFESAQKKAGKLTPVPGGVGPMTVVSLIENTIEAAEILGQAHP